MPKVIDWSYYFEFNEKKFKNVMDIFGKKKIFAMGVMAVRGPKGFRKLDYEFAEKKLNVNEIMDKLQDNLFNILGLVIKDTDGACVWDTNSGWNPTNRDLLGEFCDAGKDRNINVLVSFTSMNDAYQGHIHPERVSIHGKGGQFHGIK